MDTEGYMSVGEVSNKMKISIRTLQYYDREGILKPSAYSEGGRRLYTSKDLVLLHQILSFKRLGFSLHEIREQIIPMNSPEETLKIIVRQKYAIQEQIHNLTQALNGIEVLEKEIVQMGSVDYTKYADLVGLFMYNNEGYWVIHSMEDDLLEHVKQRFSDQPEAAMKIYNAWNTLSDDVIQMKKRGVKPQDKEGIQLIEKWWEMVNEFTGGDMSLLPKLEKFATQRVNWDTKIIERQDEVNTFIEEAMDSIIKQAEDKAREGGTL